MSTNLLEMSGESGEEFESSTDIDSSEELAEAIYSFYFDPELPDSEKCNEYVVPFPKQLRKSTLLGEDGGNNWNDDEIWNDEEYTGSCFIRLVPSQRGLAATHEIRKWESKKLLPFLKSAGCDINFKGCAQGSRPPRKNPKFKIPGPWVQCFTHHFGSSSYGRSDAPDKSAKVIIEKPGQRNVQGLRTSKPKVSPTCSFCRYWNFNHYHDIEMYYLDYLEGVTYLDSKWRNSHVNHSLEETSAPVTEEPVCENETEDPAVVNQNLQKAQNLIETGSPLCKNCVGRQYKKSGSSSTIPESKFTGHHLHRAPVVTRSPSTTTKISETLSAIIKRPKSIFKNSSDLMKLRLPKFMGPNSRKNSVGENSAEPSLTIQKTSNVHPRVTQSKPPAEPLNESLTYEVTPKSMDIPTHHPKPLLSPKQKPKILPKRKPNPKSKIISKVSTLKPGKKVKKFVA